MTWRRGSQGRAALGHYGLRWGFAVALSAIAAWLSLRQVERQALAATLTGADLPLLMVALATVLATTAAKAARWRVLLLGCGTSDRGIRIWRVLLIGQMGNSFLPARLGDVARAVLLGPRTDGGIPAVAGTLLVEKVLDGAVGLLVLVGLALGFSLPAWLRTAALMLAASTAGLLVVLVLAFSGRAWIAPVSERLVPMLPCRWQVPLKRLAGGFALGLRVLTRPSAALWTAAWSAMIWGLAALTNAAVAAALGLRVPGWSHWMVLVAVYAANFLPSVPGQVGVFEYACILALSLVGVSRSAALAFGLALHLLVIAPPAVLGPACMGIEGLRLAALRQGLPDPAAIEPNTAVR